jgi:tellurite resistance protein TerC
MPVWLWLAFLLLVGALVLLDLGVFHRRAHVVSLPQALAWTAFWVALALAFNGLVYFLYDDNTPAWLGISTAHLTGGEAAVQFFTGYLTEKSLSIDNIFVIAMILAYFRVPLAQQHRLLFWGVLGAVGLRGAMIAIGAVLIERFDWIVYVFGVLLIASAIKMLVLRHDNIDPENNLAIRLTRRVVPVSSEFHEGRFFVEWNGSRTATPLFLALILVETSDVMFAVDSIPAIFAITRDPFLVFTSNVFAILGLRSLYFALAGLMDRFRYLKMSLVLLLAYVGVKMLLSHHYPIPNPVSLAIIVAILTGGVLASVIASHRDTAPLVSPLADELAHLAKLTYRQARRVVILIVGSTVLLIGVVMLVLPGPAIVVIPLGLAILALEFAWARAWLARVRAAIDGTRERVRDHLAPREGSGKR